MNSLLTNIVNAANAGQDAARTGKSVDQCPSNISSQEASAWLSAFAEELLILKRIDQMKPDADPYLQTR